MLDHLGGIASSVTCVIGRPPEPSLFVKMLGTSTPPRSIHGDIGDFTDEHLQSVVALFQEE